MTSPLLRTDRTLTLGDKYFLTECVWPVVGSRAVTPITPYPVARPVMVNGEVRWLCACGADLTALDRRRKCCDECRQRREVEKNARYQARTRKREAA
jgi:hypothetical protein